MRKQYPLYSKQSLPSPPNKGAFMKRHILALFTLIGLLLGNPAYSGVVPSTAKYYFTTGSVGTGNLNNCATIAFSGWDGQFRRNGTGGQFLLGLVTYQNLVCTGAPSTLEGSFTVNLYFEEPTFEEVTDPIACAPFLNCSVEIGRRLVGSVVTDEVPFTLNLTANTGDPEGDSDGAFFPSANKSLWVKEGESASFFITAQYNSPIAILNIIPASSEGWVTAGTDPLNDKVFASQSDLEILSLAGVSVQVPEPTSIALFGVGFLMNLIRHRKVGKVR